MIATFFFHQENKSLGLGHQNRFQLGNSNTMLPDIRLYVTAHPSSFRLKAPTLG